MQANPLEKELLGLEQEYWQAIKDRDVQTMMRLSDERCLVTGAQGASEIKRDDFPKMMGRETATYTLNDFKLSEPKVRSLSDDVAILAYKVHEELTVEGQPVKLEAADASTWVRRDGRWLCALHTESLAGDPFGRDRAPKG